MANLKIMQVDQFALSARILVTFRYPVCLKTASLKIDLHNVLKVLTSDSGGSLEGWAGEGSWLEPY